MNMTVRTPRRPQALYLDDIERDAPRRRRTDAPPEEGPETTSPWAYRIILIAIAAEVALAFVWAANAV